jgi:hypothetical protein
MKARRAPQASSLSIPTGTRSWSISIVELRRALPDHSLERTGDAAAEAKYVKDISARKGLC